MNLVVETYQATRSFPAQERFNLTEQIHRASVSIPANIAEGSARTTAREKLQFWNVARSSLAELDTELEIAKRLGYLVRTDHTRLASLMEAVGKMLSGLMRAKRETVTRDS
jgi:four helix bundle protein